MANLVTVTPRSGRHPHKYRMLVPMVDCIFADVAQPDKARIVALNAQFFLKNSGNFVISSKVGAGAGGEGGGVGGCGRW